MGEIKTPPIRSEDENGEVVCFNSNHTLADIVRWLMETPIDAEEVLHMLSCEIEKNNDREPKA